MPLLVNSLSRRRVWLIGALSLLIVGMMVGGLFVRFRTQAGPPYSQREALRTIRIDKGFRIEPFAAEPLIKSPVAMDWDEDGRIYVAEDTGYPLDTRRSEERRVGKECRYGGGSDVVERMVYRSGE